MSTTLIERLEALGFTSEYLSADTKHARLGVSYPNGVPPSDITASACFEPSTRGQRKHGPRVFIHDAIPLGTRIKFSRGIRDATYGGSEHWVDRTVRVWGRLTGSAIASESVFEGFVERKPINKQLSQFPYDQFLTVVGLQQTSAYYSEPDGATWKINYAVFSDATHVELALPSDYEDHPTPSLEQQPEKQPNPIAGRTFESSMPIATLGSGKQGSLFRSLNIKRALFRVWVVVSGLWMTFWTVAFIAEPATGSDFLFFLGILLSVPVGLYVAWALLVWIYRGLTNN